MSHDPRLVSIATLMHYGVCRPAPSTTCFDGCWCRAARCLRQPPWLAHRLHCTCSLRGRTTSFTATTAWLPTPMPALWKRAARRVLVVAHTCHSHAQIQGPCVYPHAASCRAYRLRFATDRRAGHGYLAASSSTLDKRNFAHFSLPLFPHTALSQSSGTWRQLVHRRRRRPTR